MDEVVGALLRVASAGVKAAKFAPKGAGPLAKTGAALQGAGKATTRVAQQGTKASAVVRPAVGRAVQGAKNAIGGAVSKVKDLAKGALGKIPGGSGGKLASAAKTAGKWALGGAAFEGGMRAVQGLTGGGKGGDTESSAPKTPKAGMVDTAKGQRYKSSSDGKMYKNYNDALAARNSRRGVKPTPAPAASSSAAPSGGSGSGGGSSTPAPKSTPSTKVAPAKPSTSDTKLTSMQQWAKANPKLASKVKPGQSGYDDISAKRDTPGPNEKKDQTPTQGPADAKIDTKAVDAAVKAQQERDKNKAKPQAVNASYEYDAYDLVLEYLLSQGHVDTVEEAHYVMMEMDAETIGSIVEETK